MKFPALLEPLTQARCVVCWGRRAASARGRLLHGDQPVTMSRWPQSDEVLPQFEQRVPELELQLRTESLLRPGSIWLFKIASDGLAYELRIPIVLSAQGNSSFDCFRRTVYCPVLPIVVTPRRKCGQRSLPRKSPPATSLLQKLVRSRPSPADCPASLRKAAASRASAA